MENSSVQISILKTVFQLLVSERYTMNLTDWPVLKTVQPYILSSTRLVYVFGKFKLCLTASLPICLCKQKPVSVVLTSWSISENLKTDSAYRS